MRIIITFSSINLVKFHNTLEIGGIINYKIAIFFKNGDKKAPNLFEHHFKLLHDATIHSNNIFIFLKNFSKSMC